MLSACCTSLVTWQPREPIAIHCFPLVLLYRWVKERQRKTKSKNTTKYSHNRRYKALNNRPLDMKSTAQTIQLTRLQRDVVIGENRGKCWPIRTTGLPESGNPNNTFSMNALHTIVSRGSLILLALAGS